MHIDLATLSLLGAMQALLLAPLLLAATRAYTGLARQSLRIWGTVLLLQALGWGLLAQRGLLDDWLSVVFANAVLIASYAESARALRLLLRVPQRRFALAAIGVTGWLAIVWFWQVQPSYQARVYVMALVAGSYLGLLLWPLRPALYRGGSNAQRAMLLVVFGACATWLARLVELGIHPPPGQGLLSATPGNTLNLFYSAIEPVLASVGFLLMYNESAQGELKRLARTDSLTGTLNRLALDEEGGRLFHHAVARAQECAVLMIDVDHFKAVNDRYGHGSGDRVLATLAAHLGNHLQAGETLGRIGGEEFLVLLPGTPLGAAIARAEVLRTAVDGLRVEFDDARQATTVTISIGAAVRHPEDRHFDTLVHRADQALYRAKRAGRNRVAIEPEPAPAIPDYAAGPG